MRGKAGGGVKTGRIGGKFVAQVFDVGKLALKFGNMPLCMYIYIYIQQPIVNIEQTPPIKFSYGHLGNTGWEWIAIFFRNLVHGWREQFIQAC